MKHKYYIDHNKSAHACVIEWLDKKNNINNVTPFIDYIRCDLDGNNYSFLQSRNNDFIEVEILKFEAIFNSENIFTLCYLAWIEIDLKKHTEFQKALSFSNNEIEVVLGFKNVKKILEDCYNPLYDYTVYLQKGINTV